LAETLIREAGRETCRQTDRQKHTQTETHADRQTNIQTFVHTNVQTHRQTHTQTGMQTYVHTNIHKDIHKAQHQHYRTTLVLQYCIIARSQIEPLATVAQERHQTSRNRTIPLFAKESLALLGANELTHSVSPEKDKKDCDKMDCESRLDSHVPV
jgi:hypothetical protein